MAAVRTNDTEEHQARRPEWEPVTSEWGIGAKRAYPSWTHPSSDGHAASDAQARVSGPSHVRHLLHHTSAHRLVPVER